MIELLCNFVYIVLESSDQCSWTSQQAKGKGVLRTFWANPRGHSHSNSDSWDAGSREMNQDSSESTDDGSAVLHQAQIRLVDWIVKLLSDDIRRIVSDQQRSHLLELSGLI